MSLRLCPHKLLIIAWGNAFCECVLHCLADWHEGLGLYISFYIISPSLVSLTAEFLYGHINCFLLLCSMPGEGPPNHCIITLLDAGVTAFGPGTGPIWLEELQCVGTEERLIECPYPAPLGIHNCEHVQDVGVTCTPVGD